MMSNKRIENITSVQHHISSRDLMRLLSLDCERKKNIELVMWRSWRPIFNGAATSHFVYGHIKWNVAYGSRDCSISLSLNLSVLSLSLYFFPPACLQAGDSFIHCCISIASIFYFTHPIIHNENAHKSVQNANEIEIELFVIVVCRLNSRLGPHVFTKRHYNTYIDVESRLSTTTIFIGTFLLKNSVTVSVKRLLVKKSKNEQKTIWLNVRVDELFF